MTGKKAVEQRILIRDDGVLFNYTPALAARADMKLHVGEAPKDRAAARKAVGKPAQEPFNVATASKVKLIAFAREQYDVELSQSIPLGTLREQVLKLAAKAEAAEQDEE